MTFTGSTATYGGGSHVALQLARLPVRPDAAVPPAAVVPDAAGRLHDRALARSGCLGAVVLRPVCPSLTRGDARHETRARSRRRRRCRGEGLEARDRARPRRTGRGRHGRLARARVRPLPRASRQRRARRDLRSRRGAARARTRAARRRGARDSLRVSDEAQVRAFIGQVEEQLGPGRGAREQRRRDRRRPARNADDGGLRGDARDPALGPDSHDLRGAPGMRERGAGRIANITSIGGKISVPWLLPYSTAKFAAVGFSRGIERRARGDGHQGDDGRARAHAHRVVPRRVLQGRQADARVQPVHAPLGDACDDGLGHAARHGGSSTRSGTATPRSRSVSTRSLPRRRERRRAGDRRKRPLARVARAPRGARDAAAAWHRRSTRRSTRAS